MNINSMNFTETVKKIISYFYQDKLTSFVSTSLIFILIVFGIGMFFRFPNGDEGILAEQAFWLQKIGYVKSEMYTGLGFGWEYIQYHYHKLFIISAAGLIKIFGVNLDVLRLFILTFTSILIYYSYRYQKKYSQYQTSGIIMFFSLLMFQYHFFYFSYIFRPEIPVVCLGFLSFYFLQKFLDDSEKKHLYTAAIFSGLSALMHLNGLIYIFAGGFLLLFRKQYRNSIFFLLSSGTIVLLYFFNITSIDAFHSFVFQFTNDPNLGKEDFSFLLKINKLLDEHKRYFHSPKEIVLSLLFFVALFSNYKNLFKKNKDLVIYTLLVMFFLAGIAHDKTDKYSTLYVPFMLLVIVESIVCFLKTKSKIRIVFFILIPFYYIVNTYFISAVLYNSYDVEKRNEYFASLMDKKQTTVLTRENFFFNQIYNFKIVSLCSFDYRWNRFNSTEFKRKDLFAFADTTNSHYVLFENETYNKHVLKALDFSNLKENENYCGYKVKRISKEFVLFERYKD